MEGRHSAEFRSGVAIIIASTVIASAAWLIISSLTAMLGRLSNDLSLDTHEASLILPAISLGSLAAGAGWGVLADRRGSRSAAAAAYGVAAIALLSAALSGSLVTLFFATMFVVGVGLAGGVSGVRAVAAAFPHHRAQTIALPSSLGMGIAAGGVVGIGLLAEHGGSQAALVAMGGLCALAAAVSWLLLPGLAQRAPTPAAGTAGGWRAAATFARHEMPWGIAALTGLFAGLAVGLHVVGVLYLTQSHGLGPHALSLAVAGILLGAIVTRQVASYLADRRQAPARVLVALALAFALMAPLALLADSLSALQALLAYVLIGVVATSAGPLLKAATVDRVRTHHAGAALGLQQQVRHGASIVAPTLAGLVAGLVSFEVALAGLLALGVPALAVATPLALSERGAANGTGARAEQSPASG